MDDYEKRADTEGPAESPNDGEAQEVPKEDAYSDDSSHNEDFEEALPEASWEDVANEYKEKYLRALADNQNATKRWEKQLSDAFRYGSQDVLRVFLTVLDNLYLALSYANSSDPSVKGLAEGVELTIKDCLTKLSDYGFKELTVKTGDTFDPKFQEAVGQEPIEGVNTGLVAKMLSRGYLLHDRLLRPIKVTLVKNPEPSA
ncbi:MAG: nucleotide exchange factor GrpE [Deltaproteobacteria bacterium]|jgi:molecular chaperone GrpE|nr:nucleotide exchange factor GrpE [Deltaproteobacteria bacterium]